MEGGGQGDVMRVRAPPAWSQGILFLPLLFVVNFHQNGAIMGGEEEGRREKKKRELYIGL